MIDGASNLKCTSIFLSIVLWIASMFSQSNLSDLGLILEIIMFVIEWPVFLWWL